MVICESFNIYLSFVSIFWSFLFSPHIYGYLIGAGIYDITGPITDINMMGYGNMKQNDNGLHLRLFSRAFIIQEDSSSQPIVIVIIDAGMVSQAVKIKSIDLAYSNMKEGKILKAEGDLHNASINRSPAAYLKNPVEEQARYDENIDKNMILLKFVTMNNTPIGMINWFAVHPVSMNSTNTLVSSDNKGLASILFEQKMNHNQMLGKGPFVAAFAQANEGDVSPNTAGPRCIDTGLPCDFVHSSCGGRAQNCIAYGPGSDMFESTKLIAYKQFEKAWLLFNNATTEINGPINFIHQFIDMTNISLNYKMNTPYPWQPSIVETQIVSIGSLLIVALPGEFTTMSGRRIREAVIEAANNASKQNDPSSTTQYEVILSGLSNVYSSYIATPEEYQLQRYEGASTIYGPLTLPAYVNQFCFLAEALVKRQKVSPGTVAPYFFNEEFSFVPKILFDTAPLGKPFGAVIKQPNSTYYNVSLFFQ
ncbi:neutral ceramidase [Schistosoma bovis]|uniref:Neutral ceramidase n=1 Tax=Schistosoma bovis TaxID=6184 RepID=A0A430Q2E7_SCHBO|nr:neutral ceramidase [Schistosoma bovis]